MEFKTFLDQVVNVGDYVTYPGRMGSCVWMNVAKVLAIGKKEGRMYLKVQKTRTNWYDRDNETFKPSTLTALNNVVKIDIWEAATSDDIGKALLS